MAMNFTNNINIINLNVFGYFVSRCAHIINKFPVLYMAFKDWYGSDQEQIKDENRDINDVDGAEDDNTLFRKK